jgi:hypothetical protein
MSIRIAATRRSAGTKGTDREGGNRVPAIAWMPGKIKADSKNYDITGGLDFFATFSAMAGVPLPRRTSKASRRSSTATTSRRCSLAPGLDPRDTWDYFTENELLPGAVRFHQIKFVFNLRGGDGQPTGGLAVDSNLGWKGPESYVATCPQIFDLWAGPAGTLRPVHEQLHRAHLDGAGHGHMELKRVMQTFLQYPPRKLQSDGYTGPITISALREIRLAAGTAQERRREH